VFFGSDARAWKVGETTTRPLLAEEGIGLAVAITEDAAIVLTAPDDQQLTAVATVTASTLGRVHNPREFSRAALSHDGRVVVTADYEHDVKLWDLTQPEPATVAWRQRGAVRGVAVSDEPDLALVVSEHALEMWDTAIAEPLAEPYETAVARAERRGQSLLDASIERQIRERLTEALGGQAEEPHRGLGRPLGTLAFSHDAGRAVSAPGPGGKFSDMEEVPYEADERFEYPARLWDLADIGDPRSLHGHTSAIMCADMTRDGTHALTGSWGRTLRLWDLDDAASLHELRGHRGIVLDCALSDDARLAVSGSEDMTVRLWDLAEGTLLFTFATSSAVNACDIARDGSVVVAGEAGGRVHILEVR
jgi:WD40 repeat protein